MPSFGQFNFDGGEWSQEYWGRTDIDKYRAALKRCRNFVVLQAGSATHRPGFSHIANAGTGATGAVRLHRFTPSAATKFMLEFGAGYIRFFRKRAAILSGGGAPFQVTTPYSEPDLRNLSFAQNLNQLYIFHQGHPPQVLTWQGSDTGFVLAPAVFQDGPYLDPVVDITATPAAAGASTNVTISGIAGINGGQGFRNDDVGRLMRFQQASLQAQAFTGWGAPGTKYQDADTVTLGGGTYIRPAQLAITAIGSPATGVPVAGEITDPGQYIAVPGSFTQASTSGQGTGLTPNIGTGQNPINDLWIWGTITAVNSPTNVDVTIGALVYDGAGNSIAGQFVAGTTINGGAWRLGALCPYEGYPAAGFFFQGRLILGGTVQRPKRWWGTDVTIPSRPFANFMPTLGTMQVIASNGLDFNENDDESDPIAWFADCGKQQIPQFAIGTGDSEFVGLPPGGNALSATSIATFRDTRYTNAPIQPLRIGRALVFAERSRQRLRSWVYQWGAGGFIGSDPMPTARHLLLAGVAAMDYALTPHPVLWLAMQDGSLAGLTFQLDEGPIAAPHSHQLGGSFYGAPPFVASLAVVPSEDDTPYDEIWIAVQRADAGAGATQTIEVSTPYFRDQPIDNAVFLDAAVESTLSFPAAGCTPQWGPYQPSGNTLLPARGDAVDFSFTTPLASDADVGNGAVVRFGGGTFLVVSVTDPGNEAGTLCIDPPQSLAPAVANEWSYTRMQTVFDGFGVHAGREVTVLADGQVQGPITVAVDGAITLAVPASHIIAGLYADAELETLDLDMQAPDGTTQGKTGVMDHLYLRLFQSCGGSYGHGVDEAGDTVVLDDIEPRRAGDPADGWAPPLRSEDLRVAMPEGNTAARSVIVTQPNPWPMTITALVVKGETTEIGHP